MRLLFQRHIFVCLNKQTLDTCYQMLLFLLNNRTRLMTEIAHTPKECFPGGR